MEEILFYKIQFRIDSHLFPTDIGSAIYHPNQTIDHNIFAEIIEEKLAVITYFEESTESWSIQPLDPTNLMAATFIELHLSLNNIFNIDAVIEQCVAHLHTYNILKYHYGFNYERHVAYVGESDRD